MLTYVVGMGESLMWVRRDTDMGMVEQNQSGPLPQITSILGPCDMSSHASVNCSLQDSDS